MPFNLLLPVLFNFLLTNSSVSNFRITQFLLKREGLIVFSATKDQHMYTSLPDRPISTGPFISNSFQFYLLMYLCVHLFSATQRSFHALQPQRSISLLFCFCCCCCCCCCFFPVEYKSVASLACLATQVYFSHNPLSLSFSISFFSCQRR